MPDFFQIAGLAIKEFTPIMVNMYNTGQKEKGLLRSHDMQQETYTRMQQALEEKSFHGRFAPKPCTSPACRVEGPNRSVIYDRIWEHLGALPSTMEAQPTPEDRDRMQVYVASLVTNIPCGDCSTHARSYVAINPVDASSPQALSKWICNYRNAIREMKGQQITVQC